MKTVDFSESIAASDLKISRSRHIIEHMKIKDMKINSNRIFSETTEPI